jgi:hypothetical protein
MQRFFFFFFPHPYTIKSNTSLSEFVGQRKRLKDKEPKLKKIKKINGGFKISEKSSFHPLTFQIINI